MTIKKIIYEMFELGINRYERKHCKVHVRKPKVEFNIMHMEKINTYAEYVSALARFDELFFSTDDNISKNDPSFVELERLSALLEQYEKETTLGFTPFQKGTFKNAKFWQVIIR